MTDKVNESRRNLLIGTASVGAVGAVFAAVPFIKSWLPSERAKSAGGPVTADFSKLETGQKLDVEWRTQPIFIVRRSEEQLATLEEMTDRVKDPGSESSIQPDFAKNPYRSMNEADILVLVGICTHLGCSPKFYPEIVPQAFDSNWKSGFYCPCHKSKFDVSGRVFKDMPAATNLVVPPYKFVGDNMITIGELEGEA